MKSYFRFGLASAVMCFVALQTETRAQAKWSYPNCPDVTDADFKIDTLLMNRSNPELKEPDKLAFDMDAEGRVDVYFTEIRPGNIKRYNAASKTVTTLVTLPVWKGPYTDVSGNTKGTAIEEGATGIALDPKFKTNGWIYIHWSPASNSVFRISRFTVANNKIDIASEKIVLQFEAQRQLCCHTGGSLAFDAYGDLWIAQGANGGNGLLSSGSPRPMTSRSTNPQIALNETDKWKSEEWGASSTHGFRGGFLRIHPTDDGKYTIPKDNFGEYFARTLNKPEYLDTSKVSPEIYIKGTRNNYSMALDPVRRWVLWGDVGADEFLAKEREEYNVRQTPGFEGWPYFVGYNKSFVGNKDPKAPTNTSKWNTGLTTLPEARSTTKLPDGFMNLIQTAPISGPLYLYDGDLNSSVKLPPHFNRKWFVTDYVGKNLYVFDLDADGNQVSSFKPFLAGKPFPGPVDFRQGPDGALYIVNYGAENFATTSSTSIYKISYTGTCRPTDLKLEKPTGLAETRYDLAPRRSGFMINLGASSLVKVPHGMSGIELYDISGKQIWNARNLKAGDTFRVPSEIRTGALKYRWVPSAL